MNLKSVKNSQAGLSLIELVVVVAILGVLATLSYGPVTRQINKSKQAEAKANLGAIAQAEKMYNIEFQGYHTDLLVLGGIPEGRVRYNIGFTALVTAANRGVNGPAGAAANIDVKGACTTVASACTGLNAQAEYTAGAVITAVGTAPTVGSPTTFRAQARSNLVGTAGAANDDVWHIDQLGVMQNSQAVY